MDARIVLTVLGAVAELLGISLVILDARAARRAAIEVLRAPVATAPRRRAAGRWSSRIARPGVTYGAAWEAQQFRDMTVRFIEGLGSHFERLENQLADDMEELARRIVDESTAREQQLREALADDITSGLSRRWFGAALFVTGVCLSAAANVIG